MDRVPQTLERSGEMPTEPHLGRADAAGAFADRGYAEPARRPVPRRLAPRRLEPEDARSVAAPPRSAPEGRLPIVLAVSLGAHALAAGILAMLPAASSLAHGAETIEIEMLALAPATPIEQAPEPAIVPPEPPPIQERAPIARPIREQPIAPEPPAAALPESVLPESALPESAPPSLDDVFGEPPPPLPSLTAEGGAFAVAAGSPDGAAGGVTGGRGTTLGGTGTGAAADAAPIGPSPDAIRRARRAYATAIRELLARSARYPVAARAQRLRGRVELALRITEGGRLVSARVITSSGYPVLDDAAVATARDVDAYPTPPSLLAWDAGEELRTSLVYELTR